MSLALRPINSNSTPLQGPTAIVPLHSQFPTLPATLQNEDRPPPYEVAVAGHPLQDGPPVHYVSQFQQNFQMQMPQPHYGAQMLQILPQPYHMTQQNLPQLPQQPDNIWITPPPQAQSDHLSPQYAGYSAPPQGCYFLPLPAPTSSNVAAPSFVVPQVTFPPPQKHITYRGEITPAVAVEPETLVGEGCESDPAVRREKQLRGIELRVPSWIMERFFGY